MPLLTRRRSAGLEPRSSSRCSHDEATPGREKKKGPDQGGLAHPASCRVLDRSVTTGNAWGARVGHRGDRGAGNRPRLVALTCIFPVDLPGIETSAEITVTCGYAEFECAKRRGST